jgi:ketosteroid isomerase-like protein
MPDAATIERFVAMVEGGAHVEAIEAFYAPHATMRENGAPPRTGRDALVAHERATLARTQAVRSRCVRPVLVSGDTVVVRWVFEFDDRDGRTTRLEELAWQRWEGDRIVEETFFYDPAQLRAGRAS